MVQHVTNGVKISVKSKFEGNSYRNYRLYYAFSYTITIENQSNNTVQLISRHWNIFDSLNKTEIVKGSGVIGQKPVLEPGNEHTYQSSCFLTSSIGSMNGYYNMINIDTKENFKVYIPTFQLMEPSVYN
jgi:ApaG protein